VVYENPQLFINICNLLGNCYIKLAVNEEYYKLALDNFESSLALLEEFDDQDTSILKILCLNAAILR
jgi:hypothetical protein